jgi:hypothetical protein
MLSRYLLPHVIMWCGLIVVAFNGQGIYKHKKLALIESTANEDRFSQAFNGKRPMRF